MHGYQSWGGTSAATTAGTHVLWRHEDLALPSDHGATVLPYGLGRSYGDSCLNHTGSLLLTRTLNRFISFDPDRGELCCEAGVSFAELLSFLVPRGWFLPVTPGTQFITVGGAIANDVHGKNHHRDGTFGHAVISLELLRSDGTRLVCSDRENQELFRATVGGLGLTGLITTAKFRLRRIDSPLIEQQVVRFHNLTEFFALSEASAAGFEYTVAWIDCLARGKSLGRGLYIRGNHAKASSRLKLSPPPPKTVPFYFPGFALNAATVRMFNFAYYHKSRLVPDPAILHFVPFFYPLDAVQHWNRIYGRQGFYQYQCVLPVAVGADAMRDVLGQIAAARLGSFLAVLKVFGAKGGAGMMSFPRQGITLALDFPNSGAKTLQLLTKLDAVIMSAGGALYPAKDARMSAAAFQNFYPQWQNFKKFIDPRFSSSFWRRVTET